MFSLFLTTILLVLKVNVEPDVMTVGAPESLQQMVRPFKSSYLCISSFNSRSCSNLTTEFILLNQKKYVC